MLFGSPCLSREKNPKEKSPQLGLQQPRQGPTDEAQMAAAAALARLEQKQPRARGPTSQDSIRNQGENYRGESMLTGRGSQRQQWIPQRQATQVDLRKTEETRDLGLHSISLGREGC